MKKFLFLGALSLVLAGCIHAGYGGATDRTQTAPSDTVEEDEGAMEEKDSPSLKASEEQGGAAVEIRNFKHSPSRLTVKPGETVTVTNFDIAGHTVTSDDGSSFDTGVMSKDKTVTFTAPTTLGEYSFFCSVHPNMRATLVVEG